jgi:uncharacterized protein (TIGR02466 family)
MDSGAKVEITSIFSVPICEHHYDDDLGDLEEECIKRSTLDSGRIATNSGGWQSNDIFSNDDFFSDFILEIEKQGNNFAKKLEICQKVKLSNLWININGYKDFNRRHTHQSSILSGVFYVKVPDKFSKLRFYHPAFHLMMRDWDVDIKYNEYTSDIWNIIPEEGKLVLFPSWLEHEVDQNLSQEKRISISFNLVGES